MRPSALAWMLTLAISLPAIAVNEERLKHFDASRNGQLEYTELLEYLLSDELDRAREQGFSERRLRELAEDWGVDLITADCDQEPCTLTINEETAAFINDFAKPSDVRKTAAELHRAAKKERVGWRTLGFKRFVTDPVSPRPFKAVRPVLLLAKRDNEAGEGEKKDEFTFLGAVQLFSKTFEGGRKANVPNRFFTFTPGIQMDIDTGKPAAESSLSAAIPLSWEWVAPAGSSSPFSSQVLMLTPTYLTDRDFDREAYELSLQWFFQARNVGSGYYRYLGKKQGSGVRFTWAPTIELKTGKVEDAAGNERLQAIADSGDYQRAVARVTAKFVSMKGKRSALAIDYFHRYDFGESWDRGYLEAALTYDANKGKNVQLSLVYSKGKKPPAFEKRDELLFGIGLLQ